jgi:phosphomannomutase
LVELFDPRPAYFAQLRRLVDVDSLRSADLKVCIDPMYGAGIGYLRELLDGDKLALRELHGERNPLFPGLHSPEPIGRNLDALAVAVRDEKAAIGLATDGDADRVGIIDEKGDTSIVADVEGLTIPLEAENEGP